MPIAKVRMPDGRIARLNVPEGTTPDQVTQFVANMGNAPAQATSPSPQSAPLGGDPSGSDQSLFDQLKRATGMTARALATGALAIPAMGADAIAAGSNKLFGTRFPNQSQLIQDTMTKFGLPKPEGLADAATMFMGGMAGGVPMGSMMDKAIGQAVQKATGTVAPLYNAPPSTVNPAVQSLQEGRQAGYKFTPSEIRQAAGKDAGGGVTAGQVAQSVAGNTALERNMTNSNQQLTNALARKAAGLPHDVPLSDSMLEKAIQNTYETGYGPINSLGKIPAYNSYRQELDSIAKNMAGVSRSFPNAADNNIADLANAYRVKSMDAEDAIKAIAQLRKGGSEPELAIANALENNIDTHLQNLSKTVTSDPNIPTKTAQEIMQGFRSARTQIAKQFAVKNNLVEGTGNFNAAKMGQLFNKNPNYYTDELATIGKVANAAPQVMGLGTRKLPLLAGGLEGLSGIGGAASFASGHPVVGAVALGAPFARAALRQGLMSNMAQNMMIPAEQGASLAPNLYQLGTGLYGMTQ